MTVIELIEKLLAESKREGNGPDTPVKFGMYEGSDGSGQYELFDVEDVATNSNSNLGRVIVLS